MSHSSYPPTNPPQIGNDSTSPPSGSTPSHNQLTDRQRKRMGGLTLIVDGPSVPSSDAGGSQPPSQSQGTQSGNTRYEGSSHSRSTMKPLPKYQFSRLLSVPHSTSPPPASTSHQPNTSTSHSFIKSHTDDRDGDSGSQPAQLQSRPSVQWQDPGSLTDRLDGPRWAAPPVPRSTPEPPCAPPWAMLPPATPTHTPTSTSPTAPGSRYSWSHYHGPPSTPQRGR